MSGLETSLTSATDFAARATLLLAGAAGAVWTLRRAAAPARHAVLVLTAGALLALPFAAALLPSLSVPLLAARPWAPGGSAPAVRPVADPIVRVALAVWLTGVTVALGRLALGAAAIRRIGRTASPVTDDAWQDLLRSCTRELGLAQPPRLLKSGAVAAAVVYGHRPPTVVLADDADAWPQEQRRAFLLHELAHVRRRDVATRALAEVARALYWPHPLAWWLVRRQSAEAERACDDRVLRGGVDACDYASYLLDAARSLAARAQPASVLGVAGPLESRMAAILDAGQRRTPLSGRAWAGGAAVSLVCLVSAAAFEPTAARQDPAPVEESEPARPVVEPAPTAEGEPSLATRAPRAPRVPRAPRAPRAPRGVRGGELPPLPPLPAIAPVAPLAAVEPVLAPAPPAPVLAPPPPPPAKAPRAKIPPPPAVAPAAPPPPPDPVE